MPSNGSGMGMRRPGRRVDFVLGDCYGSACDPVITDTAEAWLVDQGYVVARNAPYAGGYTTRHYGRPRAGVHAIQIEINRALYMDESALKRKPFIATLTEQMGRMIAEIGMIDAKRLAP
jgi:N-formylglutamate amidohydrolase